MTIRVSSSSFFNYLVAQSTTKVTRVREAKRMMTAPHDDHVQMDYWHSLRTIAVDFVIHGRSASHLDRRLGAVADQRKTDNYAAVADGLKRWRGRKSISAEKITSNTWTHGGLSISVTPELLVSWPGQGPFVTKLYFSSEPLSKYKTAPMLRLLELTHGNLGTAAVLDTRRGKLHTGPTSRPADLDILLETEAASFVQVWNRL